MKPGHNNPPSDYDAIAEEVESLYGEAENWLDGEPAQTEGQAKALKQLMEMLRAAEKKRAAAFKEEKQPWLDRCREIDDRWRPLKERIERAIKGCRAALTPWLEEQDRLHKEAERKAREEAERQRREAEEAIHKSQADIKAREEAEKALKAAKQAERQANKIVREPKGYRTYYEAEIVDLNVAIKHYWTSDRPEFEALIQRLADRDVKAKKRSMPGINVVERKVAT